MSVGDEPSLYPVCVETRGMDVAWREVQCNYVKKPN